MTSPNDSIDARDSTPRQFRNALYEHLVAHGVSTETASHIAGEAEIYADGYDAFKLRDIEFAARQMGLQLTSPKFKNTGNPGEESGSPDPGGLNKEQHGQE